MKAGWEIKKLGELASVITKGTTPTSIGHQFVDEGINFVKVESISQTGAFICNKFAHVTAECHQVLKRSQLQAGDILFSIAGALGRTAIVTPEILPANTNQALALVRLKPEFQQSKEYLALALGTGFVLEQIERLKGGVAQLNLSLEQVKGFNIPIPPLSEQAHIVGILDEAFASIATAKANTQKNLENAKAVFESHLNSVFSKVDCPEVEIRSIGEVYDGPHATPKTVDSGPIFLGISSLDNGSIDLSETRHVTEEDFVKWTRRVEPKAKDIVFSYETRLGQVAIVPENLRCCLGRRMGLVRLRLDRIHPKFFVYQYISPKFKTYLDGKTVRGATVDRIALKDFPNFKIGLPPMSRQLEITNEIDQLREDSFRLTSLYSLKLSALEDLKKSLLHQAFTGKL